jgi:hypothetical protein
MTSLKIADILRQLNPDGKQYVEKDIFLIDPVDNEGYDCCRSNNARLPTDQLKGTSVLGFTTDIPTFTIDSFHGPAGKLTQTLQLLGLPQNIQGYPINFQRATLKATIIQFAEELDTNSRKCLPFTPSLMASFKVTPQSLKAFVFCISNDSSPILLLFVDGKLTKRQTINNHGEGLSSEELIDSEGRPFHIIQSGDDLGDHEYTLVDLPNPFYIVKRYAIDNDQTVNMYYSVKDYGNPDKNQLAISPGLSDLLIEYLKQQKKMMAQQFQGVISQKIPGVIDIIANYL